MAAFSAPAARHSINSATGYHATVNWEYWFTPRAVHHTLFAVRRADPLIIQPAGRNHRVMMEAN
jgi:hypothetical protein